MEKYIDKLFNQIIRGLASYDVTFEEYDETFGVPSENGSGARALIVSYGVAENGVATVLINHEVGEDGNGVEKVMFRLDIDRGWGFAEMDIDFTEDQIDEMVEHIAKYLFEEK